MDLNFEKNSGEGGGGRVDVSDSETDRNSMASPVLDQRCGTMLGEDSVDGLVLPLASTIRSPGFNSKWRWISQTAYGPDRLLSESKKSGASREKSLARSRPADSSCFSKRRLASLTNGNLL